MKSNKKPTFVLGALFFLSIVLTFVLLDRTGTTQELTFDQALTRIKNKEATEVKVKGNTLELTAKTKDKFTSKLDASDSTRENILAAANETGTTIKLEPASSGWGWILLLNSIPFIMMLAVILTATVYVVKTLTKNKG